MYAISYESEYAIEYTFEIQGNYLSEVKIPVKYKFDLDPTGLLMLTLYKNCNGTPCEVMTDPLYMEINENEKYLSCKLDEPVEIENSNFFILINRIKPNEEFFIFPDKKLLSINPFFYIIAPENQKVYTRKISESQWHLIDPEVQVVPVIKVKFLVTD